MPNSIAPRARALLRDSPHTRLRIGDLPQVLRHNATSARLGPCQALHRHDLGGASGRGRGSLERRAGAGRISSGAAASAAGQARPTAHRTRCSSPPSGAYGSTQCASTAPSVPSAMQPTGNRPRADPDDVAELLKLRRVSGICIAFCASASPPRRTDAVIYGRTCLQGFCSEGGEDVRSCPRTPCKMSRDAVDPVRAGGARCSRWR